MRKINIDVVRHNIKGLKLEDETRKFTNLFSKMFVEMINDGLDQVDVTLVAHETIDNALKNLTKGWNTSCSNCTSGDCCHQLIGTSATEVALLADVIIRTNSSVDIDRLKRQSSYIANSKVWYNQTMGDRRCIFLNDLNQCRIYKHRPIVCRNFYVVSDPKLCDTTSVINTVDNLNHPIMDAMVTAMTLYDPCVRPKPYNMYLPKQLRDSLIKRGYKK